MAMAFLYEFTGNWGDTLWDSMDEHQRDKVWQQMTWDEHDYRKEACLPRGDDRYKFVENMISELHEYYDDEDEAINGAARAAGIFLDDEASEYVAAIYEDLNVEKELEEWLWGNPWPIEGFDEDDRIEGHADDWESIGETCQFFWDDMEAEKEDDFITALNMGYLKYGGLSDEFTAEESRLEKIISAIEKKYEPFRKAGWVEVDGKHEWKVEWAHYDKGHAYRHKVVPAEKALEDHKDSIILVTGYTDTQDGEHVIDTAMDRNDIPRCPECEEMVMADSMEYTEDGCWEDGKWDAGWSLISRIDDTDKDDFVLEVLSLCSDADIDEHYPLRSKMMARKMAAELCGDEEESESVLECPNCGSEEIKIAEFYFELKGQKMPEAWLGFKMAERLAA